MMMTTAQQQPSVANGNNDTRVAAEPNKWQQQQQQQQQQQRRPGEASIGVRGRRTPEELRTNSARSSSAELTLAGVAAVEGRAVEVCGAPGASSQETTASSCLGGAQADKLQKVERANVPSIEGSQRQQQQQQQQKQVARFQVAEGEKKSLGLGSSGASRTTGDSLSASSSSMDSEAAGAKLDQRQAAGEKSAQKEEEERQERAGGGERAAAGKSRQAAKVAAAVVERAINLHMSGGGGGAESGQAQQQPVSLPTLQQVQRQMQAAKAQLEQSWQQQREQREQCKSAVREQQAQSLKLIAQASQSQQWSERALDSGEQVGQAAAPTTTTTTTTRKTPQPARVEPADQDSDCRPTSPTAATCANQHLSSPPSFESSSSANIESNSNNHISSDINIENDLEQQRVRDIGNEDSSYREQSQASVNDDYFAGTMTSTNSGVALLQSEQPNKSSGQDEEIAGQMTTLEDGAPIPTPRFQLNPNKPAPADQRTLLFRHELTIETQCLPKLAPAQHAAASSRCLPATMMNQRIKDLSNELSLLGGASSSQMSTPTNSSVLSDCSTTISTTLLTEAEMNSSELIPKLIERLDRKLVVMKKEQFALMKEIEYNELSGQRLFECMRQRLSPSEFDKIQMHAEEIEKVTKLILSLKLRLKRIEQELKEQNNQQQQQQQQQHDSLLLNDSASSTSSFSSDEQTTTSTTTCNTTLFTSEQDQQHLRTKHSHNHNQNLATSQPVSQHQQHQQKTTQSAATAASKQLQQRAVSDPTSTVGLPKRNHHHHASLQAAASSSGPPGAEERPVSSGEGAACRQHKSASSDSIFNSSADSAIGSCTIIDSSSVSSGHGGSSSHINNESGAAPVQHQRRPQATSKPRDQTCTSSRDNKTKTISHSSLVSSTSSSLSPASVVTDKSARTSPVHADNHHDDHRQRHYLHTHLSSSNSVSSHSSLSSASSVPSSPSLMSPTVSTDSSSAHHHRAEASANKTVSRDATAATGAASLSQGCDKAAATSGADASVTCESLMNLISEVDILMAKRNKLVAQLEEAHQLEECIARRNSNIVERILKKYYDDGQQQQQQQQRQDVGEIALFRQFTKLKSLLLKDSHDINDRIENAEHQLSELKQTSQCQL